MSFLVAVMKSITAVLISFNWSSFNRCSPSNLAIVPLKVVLFELKISYTVFISLCHSPYLRCNECCFSSSLDIVGTMFLYLLSFVLFDLLCHLLRHFFVFSLYFWWCDYLSCLQGLHFFCYLCQFVSCFIFDYSLMGWAVYKFDWFEAVADIYEVLSYFCDRYDMVVFVILLGDCLYCCLAVGKYM